VILDGAWTEIDLRFVMLRREVASSFQSDSGCQSPHVGEPITPSKPDIAIDLAPSYRTAGVPRAMRVDIAQFGVARRRVLHLRERDLRLVDKSHRDPVRSRGDARRQRRPVSLLLSSFGRHRLYRRSRD
jgi:hypothetical protein